MTRVPVVFWVGVGVAGLVAYSIAHRKALVASAARRESQEASTPLQPFTQPQPASQGYTAYGAVPFGNDAVTSTAPRLQFVYTSQQGALA